MLIDFLSRPLKSNFHSKSTKMRATKRRILVIDVWASCTRLTKELGDGVVNVPSISGARAKLSERMFDAVMLVACGYGSRALSLVEIESVVHAATDIPVLVIVESEDWNVARHVLDVGAFGILIRGVATRDDVRRMIDQAIDLKFLRALRDV